MSVTQGFILSSSSKDSAGATQIEFWLSTESGPVLLTIDAEKPVFFILQDDVEQAKAAFSKANLPTSVTPLKLSTFASQHIAACYSNTVRNALRAADLLAEAGIVTYESDIKLADRFLMERYIRGSIEFQGKESNKADYLLYSQAKCRKGDFIPNLKVVSLDIECSEKGVLYSIGLDSEVDSRVIMIGNDQPAQTNIEWVNNEYELLTSLCQWFKAFDPDVVVGWSVIDFDFKLLHKRAEYHNLPLKIGRAGRNSSYRTSKQSQQNFVNIPGRVVIDGIDALKTATFNFRSWSLESVSRELLGEGKAIHNVHNRMDEINFMFKKDKPALAKYNLQDCVLVNRIFKHTHLLDFLVERSRLTGLALDRTGAPSRHLPTFICHKFTVQGISHPICIQRTGLPVPVAMLWTQYQISTARYSFSTLRVYIHLLFELF